MVLAGTSGLDETLRWAGSGPRAVICLLYTLIPNVHLPHFLQCLHLNLWHYRLPDMLQLYSFMSCQITFEKMHQALSEKKLITLISKIFKKKNASLIVCANCF